MKYSRSGQYELLKLYITTNTNNPVEIDVRSAFIDATVYESIFDQTMSGNVTLADTNNLVQKYGLGNGELVTIEWTTAGVNDATIVSEGVVYDMTPPMRINDHASAFTLHFTSPEMITSMRQKMFNGYRDSCSNIVNVIFDRIRRSSKNNQKNIELSSTKNIEHIVFTGQTPLDAIRLLTNRSISTNNMSGYMFFEDNTSYKFKPIEELYAQDPVIEYSYRSSSAFEDVKNSHEETSSTFKEFDIDYSNKYADEILDGQYGSATAYFSLKNKSINILNYDASSNFNVSSSLGKTPFTISSSFNDKYSDRLSINYSSEHNVHEIAKVQNRMKLLKSNSFMVNIGVFGLSTIKVGDVCLAKIPTFSSESLSVNDTDHISGKFLIAEIKHILTPKLYNQRIRLIKDSYEENIA